MLAEKDTDRQPSGTIVAAVSREIVRLYARTWGRGPTRARTHLQGDHVLCVLEDVLTRAEGVLVEAGHGEQVLQMRNSVHEELAPELIRIVQEQTGRPVRVCVGQVDGKANLAIEYFSFAEAADG